MVKQYSQGDLIDSQDAIADAISSKNNDTLSVLQKRNIGEGLAGFYPLSEITGKCNTNIGFDRINQSLKVILHTVKGEIPMLPKLGSNLDKLLFEPIDDVLDSDLQFAIMDAINEFEPRIKLIEINISHDERVLNKVHISITYVLTNTNIVHQFEEDIYTSNGGVA